MKQILSGIEPERVFLYFEKIASIPHGSYHTEQLSEYCSSLGKEWGYDVSEDEFHNVLIRKPASKGFEKAPTIILQGHLDMVCEKNKDSNHNFEKDGLELCVDGDNLFANGTTLGGDDGIAVAYGLAILEDKTLVHPPLEVLFTTEEEVGMEGAYGFDVSKLKGKYLINLDSEEEGSLLVSCAGGITAFVSKKMKTEEAKGYRYELTIRGLKGGHSGSDIHLGRANANIIMGRILSELEDQYDIRIAQIEGGCKSNAIPREAEAVIYLDGQNASKAIEIVDEYTKLLQKEYATTENELKICFCASDSKNEKVYSKEDSEKLIDMLYESPDGVFAMSQEIEGFVESSRNLGVVSIKEEKAELVTLIRTSNLSAMEEMKTEIENISQKNGFEVMYQGFYKPWEYRKNSKLRDLVTECYEEQYGKKMKVESMHAGLECGVFADKMDMDIVSMGPDILDIHTPKETLKISSVKRTYELLLNILEKATQLH